MKLQIVNIIVINDNNVQSIASFMFDDNDKESREEMINKAEALYKEKAIELGYDEDDYPNFDYFLEEGYFQNGNASVNIAWSDVDWV